ncbi:hypothetical protein PIB30_090835 [Stylosanthes scabra]|uniref:Uncharacterized protein n=1 Tax=Stylosanthes scabra TaxID=79078 RepID=A0ABU6TUY8_9FABA|nr:hypothetical protein [Stylosanthes scabra]
MAPKGKAKVHQPPTHFSLRLAALKTHQSRDMAGPSRTAPINVEPIEISSDSVSEEVPEYIPGTGQSDDKEVLEYIPEDWPTENQNPGEEEPGANHEMDPNLDPEEEEDLEEEEEEDPEEEEEEDPEEEEEPEEEHGLEEVQEEAERDPSDDDEFRDYFALAPPASPDSSDDSTPPADN